MMIRVIGALLCLVLHPILSGQLHAAPMVFDYTAHVDGSDRPGAPTGSLLTGRITYDPDAMDREIGTHYYPTVGSATMTARGSEGFSLTQYIRVIVVTPGYTHDTMTLQTFLSESANDWHMVMDLIEPGGDDGWLQGDNSLPSMFPAVLEDAFLSLYFTDEGDWTRSIDATVMSITPSSVPLPAAGWLFFSAVFGLAVMKRRDS